MKGFTCSCCGKYFDQIPLDFGYSFPDYWAGLSEDEKSEGFLNEDACTSGEFRFVRGILKIRIIGTGEYFVWGVWVSLSQKNYDHYLALWDDTDTTKEQRYFGWLSNQIKGYPDTSNLKTSVQLQGVGLRPLIELDPTDHPLAVEQQEGITEARVREIVELHHQV